MLAALISTFRDNTEPYPCEGIWFTFLQENPKRLAAFLGVVALPERSAGTLFWARHVVRRCSPPLNELSMSSCAEHQLDGGESENDSNFPENPQGFPSREWSRLILH